MHDHVFFNVISKEVIQRENNGDNQVLTKTINGGFNLDTSFNV